MTRRCSHCSNNGHNSRTCPARGGGGVRLFGVRLTAAEDPTRLGSMAMKKSASMGNLSSAAAAHVGGGSGCGSPSSDPLRDRDPAAAGYASDDPTHASCSSSCRSDRKKGIPWTEEEHRMFLLGLQKLGKGDWRGIARNFVVSRTPTQVASHAQKYFIRQINTSRRKRRSSLFDMIPEVQMDHLPVLEEQLVLQSPPSEPENTNQLPSHPFCQDQDPVATEPELENPPTELKESIPFSNVPLSVVPTFFPAALIPMPFPFWPPTLAPPTREEEMGETHEVLKPTPVLPKDLINVDEVVGLSKLSIGEGVASRMEPSALSLKLLRDSATRQSAFHVKASVAGPELTPSNTNAIHAV